MPDALQEEVVFDPIENIKGLRTPEKLSFQVLLEPGVDLTLPIAQANNDGKTIFFVGRNALCACFEIGITEDLSKS